MTFKTTKSHNLMLFERGLLGESFEKAVELHCAELNAWHEREEAVRKQPPMPPRPDYFDFANEEDPAAAFAAAGAAWSEQRMQRLDPYPRPNAIVDVEAACRFDGEKFVPDYEVVNDDPTPEDLLKAKKSDLLVKVQAAENAALDKVRLPPGKERIVNIVLAQINIADEKAAKEITAAFSEDDLRNMNLFDEIANRRSPEHKKMLAEIDGRNRKIQNIELQAAVAMSEIEDLTAESIDSYVLPTFET